MQGVGPMLSHRGVCERAEIVGGPGQGYCIEYNMEKDVSLVSITPWGNLMFLREEGLASMDIVQMVCVCAI